MPKSIEEQVEDWGKKQLKKQNIIQRQKSLIQK